VPPPSSPATPFDETKGWREIHRIPVRLLRTHAIHRDKSVQQHRRELVKAHGRYTHGGVSPSATAATSARPVSSSSTLPPVRKPPLDTSPLPKLRKPANAARGAVACAGARWNTSATGNVGAAEETAASADEQQQAVNIPRMLRKKLKGHGDGTARADDAKKLGPHAMDCWWTLVKQTAPPTPGSVGLPAAAWLGGGMLGGVMGGMLGGGMGGMMGGGMGGGGGGPAPHPLLLRPHTHEGLLRHAVHVMGDEWTWIKSGQTSDVDERAAELLSRGGDGNDAPPHPPPPPPASGAASARSPIGGAVGGAGAGLPFGLPPVEGAACGGRGGEGAEGTPVQPPSTPVMANRSMVASR
jgi:hypothetical protein